MIRKLGTRKYRLYSHRRNPATGRRRNLGTFTSRAAAKRREGQIQWLKRHHA